jgi:hypothetical protein
MTPKTIKSLLAIVVLCCAPLAFAADTNIIPSLTIAGKTFRNVQLGTANASHVTIFYDGGGERVAISNLPMDLQKRLNYDPEKARAIEAADAVRKAAAQERNNQNAAAIAKAKSKLGPAEPVRVLKVINPARLQIAGKNGMLTEAYIHNLPLDVISFVNDYNATKEAVQADKYVDYHDAVGGKSQASFSRQAQKAENQRHLADLEGPYGIHAKECSTVFARPTDYFYSQTPLIRQWEYQGRLAPGFTP